MTKQPESDLIQSYFYGLIKNVDVPEPTTLDRPTIEAIRDLVKAEQQLMPATNLEQVKAQVWQRVLGQTEAKPGNSASTSAGVTTPHIPTPAKPRTTWRKQAVILGMVATIAVVFVGVLVGILLSSLSGQDNLGSGSKTIGTGYRINVNVTTKSTDAKRLTITTQLLQRRLESISKEPVNVNQTGTNTLVIELPNSIPEQDAVRLINGQGLVEFVVTNGEAFKQGDEIQTSYCNNDNLQQSKVAICNGPSNPNKLTDSKGQPFQTLLTNDSVNLQSTQNGLKQTLAELTKMRSKLLTTYPKLELAIAVDSKVLNTVKLTNVSDAKLDISLVVDSTLQGKQDLNLLDTLFNYGALPLSLEVASIDHF